MTPADRRCIEQFANGEVYLREQAIAIYRKHLREWVHGNERCPYMNFMSEVDNPCPDLSLRAYYRIRLTQPQPVDTIRQPTKDRK